MTLTNMKRATRFPVLRSVPKFLSATIMGLSFLSQAALAADSKEQWKAKQLWNLCSQCHGDSGEGKQIIGAPAIAGMPEWYILAQLTKYKSGARASHPRDYVGLRMRPMARHLKDNEIPIIAAYTAALPVPPIKDTVIGNPLRGEKSYQVCISCHGAEGLGNKDIGSPPLVTTNDWYLYGQLKHFKASIRGGNAEADPMGASMVGMANTLADDQAMLDVVAYINTLRPVAAAKAPQGH